MSDNEGGWRTSLRLRSENWFNDPSDPGMTAIYIERFLNYGITIDELQSRRPIIGIAQTGSDLSPCNRVHVDLADRVRDGIRDAGGIPIVFPVHPIQESCRRPTAALDRNLAYLGLVEILHGYPFDGVVLTTGCDKTTPAGLMAAATTNLPAIVLSGGPMLDGYLEGKPTGAGVVVWEARRRLSAGEIDFQEFLQLVERGTPSVGHCNVMGTALSMNSLAETLGMSLPGCAAIPAPYRERRQMAYATGRRAVEIVWEQLTPDKIMTRAAFENAIVVNTALGGSTNCPPHLTAVARHLGIQLDLKEWQRIGYDVPLLANVEPAGEHFGEGFFRAGGVPAVVGELMAGGLLNQETLTINGKTLGENCASVRTQDAEIIRPTSNPLKQRAGFLILGGNLFDAALIKTSVIRETFRTKYLADPEAEDCFTVRAIVFEGPEDYHHRIDDPELNIDERCMLVIRGCGPVGYPGSAEVVNMLPPARLVKAGINELPCLGDGRQSGTSGSPSILNASPESAVGGGLALLETDDLIRVDLRNGTVNVLVDEATLAERRQRWSPPTLSHETPWQEIYRDTVGQLDQGGCIEAATDYQNVCQQCPRRNH